MKKICILALFAGMAFCGWSQEQVTPAQEQIQEVSEASETIHDGVAVEELTADTLAVAPVRVSQPLSPDGITFPAWLLPRVFYGYVKMPADSLVIDNSGEADWKEKARRVRERNDRMVYDCMIANPSSIQYAFWQLPVPPEIAADPNAFSKYVGKGNVATPSDLNLGEGTLDVKPRHWLHEAGASLQFSQAYISPNWYQGGTGSLSLFGQARWNVKLNQAYHPKVMFDNTLQYKIGLSSQPLNKDANKDAYRDYMISEDIFQWNMLAGYKAWDKFFYSVSAQFKTPIFKSYPMDKTQGLRSAFLSPGDLTLGAGFTYQTTNKSNTFNFAATLSLLSYNLKICTNSNTVVYADDGTPTYGGPIFGITNGKQCQSFIGSSAEANMTWNIAKNIQWRSRFFIFSNYKYVQTEWENTFSFNVNKWLTTQILIHPRYDSTASTIMLSNSGKKWQYFMLKEILSFGLVYTFATAP